MKELKKVPPNKGIEHEYKRKLDKLVKAMSASVMYWVLADYGNRTAYEMATAIRKRIKQWDRIFGEEAQRIALWFVNNIKRHTETGMALSFKEAGLKMKRATPQEVMKAVEVENVELIKSVPEKYFIGVKEVALLSLMYGWSKDKLNEELVKRKGIVERRVKNIASDQTHKTTELIKRGLCVNNGIYTAKWKYTFLSEHPRENHIQMDGMLFDARYGCVEEGTGDLILPTQKIGCKCSFTPVIPEYGDDIEKEIEKNSYYRNLVRF